MAAKRKRQKQARRNKRAQQRAASPSERLKQAVGAFNQGQFESAHALASNVLKHTNATDLVGKARQVSVEACLRLAATAPGYEPKLSWLEQALVYAPSDARLYYQRGLLLWRMGRTADALQDFDRVVQTDRQRPGVAYLQQMVRLATGRTHQEDALSPAEANMLHLVQKFKKDAAAEEIEPLLEKPLLGEKSASIWRALLEMREKPKAAPVDALNTAQGKQSASSVVDYYRGVAALRRGDYRPALDAWRAAMQRGFMRPWLQENRFGLLRERAVDLAGSQRWQEIIAITADQSDFTDDNILAETVAAAHFQLGYSAAKKGQWAQAVTHWRTASELNSNRYVAQNLALAEEALENWEDAAQAWREVARRRPRKESHPDYLTDIQVSAIWAHAANCYAKAEAEEDEWSYAGLYEEKITCLKNAVKYAPDNIEVRINLVDAYLEEDRDEAAENELDRILEIDEDNVPALARLGTVYAGQWGRNPIPVWERALDLEPNNSDVRDALAEAVIAEINGEGPYFWRTRYRSLSDRIQKLEETLQRVPNHPALLFELGLFHRNAGNDREAMRALSQSWDAAPNDARAAGRAMHELLHVAGGEQVVTERLPRARQMTGIRPAFWIAQALSVFNCELDEEWAVNFWDEAIALADKQSGPDTLVFTLVSIVESGLEEEFDDLVEPYEERLRQEFPSSGAIEYLDAYRANFEDGDLRRATRLMRTAQQKARKAGETQLADKAQHIIDLLSGRGNPLLNILGSMGGGPSGLADLFDELDMDEEEFMEDILDELGRRLG